MMSTAFGVNNASYVGPFSVYTTAGEVEHDFSPVICLVTDAWYFSLFSSYVIAFS